MVLPLRRGDPWTTEKQSEVLQAIRAVFESEFSLSYLFSQANLASVLYIDVDEQKDEAAHTVKLTFRPLQVHLSTMCCRVRGRLTRRVTRPSRGRCSRCIQISGSAAIGLSAPR